MVTYHRSFVHWLLVIWLGTALLARPAISAAGPERFLFVKAWTATFTRSLADNGHGMNQDCSADWNYGHSVTVNATLELDEPTANHPWFRSWTAIQNDGQQVVLNEKITQTCPNGDEDTTMEWQATQTGPPPSGFMVGVDAQAGTYDVGFFPSADINAELSFRIDEFEVFTQPTTVSWYPNTILTFPLPQNGIAITGGDTNHARDCATCVAHYDLSLATGVARYLDVGLAFTWSLTPSEVEELELVVEPVGYDTWLPQGNLADWNQRGTNWLVKARLQTKDGHEPTFRAQKIKFSLTEVSRQPGVCLNRPTRTLADTDPDLRFEETLTLPPHVSGDMTWIDTFTVETSFNANGYAQAEARISCYDFGAFGKVKVTAEVGGREIVGYLKGDPSKTSQPILLPKRSEPSFIADVWKNNSNASSLADGDDSEDKPVGDGHKGDGLTLYEEYRGFSENLKHRRGNPTKKDLFVADLINNWRSKNGIALFAAQSGLEVHHRMRAAELSSRADQIDRWINFNTDNKTPHVVDQHGLVMQRRATAVGYHETVTSPGFEHVSTPASAELIFIEPYVTASRHRRTNIEGMNEISRNGIRVVTDGVQSAIAHELAHGCSVWHHGTGDTKPGWDIAWQVTSANSTIVAKEDGFQIELRDETDTPLVYPPFIGPRTVTVGQRRCEHSGVEDCFMRYDVADAYPKFPNIRYWIGGDEASGVSMCTTSAGTGVNAPAWLPQSRYGDADTTKRRGNCKGQICVNDLYVSDSLHDRN